MAMAGITGGIGIVAVGVVMGAVLIAMLGGGVATLAPIVDSGGAGTLPDIEDVGVHVLVTASSAYPSGHVIEGATVVVGVVKPSQLEPWQRTYNTTSRRATGQLTFW
jgi:hypothetical protein